MIYIIYVYSYIILILIPLKLINIGQYVKTKHQLVHILQFIRFLIITLFNSNLYTDYLCYIFILNVEI